jgi:hypothetical protein
MISQSFSQQLLFWMGEYVDATFYTPITFLVVGVFLFKAVKTIRLLPLERKGFGLTYLLR